MIERQLDEEREKSGSGVEDWSLEVNGLGMGGWDLRC
jgi:hypothetical protein